VGCGLHCLERAAVFAEVTGTLYFFEVGMLFDQFQGEIFMDLVISTPM
jgi:hypothetical protein